MFLFELGVSNCASKGYRFIYIYTHTHTYTERDLGNIMITYKGNEFFVLVRDSTQFTTTLQAHIMPENLVIVNL